MERMNIQAFIETPYSYERAKALNEIVAQSGIGILTGDKGAGKDRFLDWWWQIGAAHQRIPEGIRIRSSDIVFINLVPTPRSSLSMSCVVLFLIWHQLKALNHSRDWNKERQPITKPRRWGTERDILSLYADLISPLMEELRPRAIVIGNAHYLDEQALQWLLLLRTHAHFGNVLAPGHALILSAQLPHKDEESSKFARMARNSGEVRIAWNNHIALSPMSESEFKRIIVTMVRKNLKATFSPETQPDKIIEEFYEWTKGNWWYIAELGRVFDQTLGPAPTSGEARTISTDRMDHFRDVWVRRMPVSRTSTPEVMREDPIDNPPTAPQ